MQPWLEGLWVGGLYKNREWIDGDFLLIANDPGSKQFILYAVSSRMIVDDIINKIIDC
jgi:hypothetical protein